MPEFRLAWAVFDPHCTGSLCPEVQAAKIEAMHPCLRPTQASDPQAVGTESLRDRRIARLQQLMRMIPTPLGVGHAGKYPDLEAIINQFQGSEDYDFSFAKTLLGLVANAIRVDHETGLSEGESYRRKELLFRCFNKRREWKGVVKLAMKFRELHHSVSAGLVANRLHVWYQMEVLGLWQDPLQLTNEPGQTQNGPLVVTTALTNTEQRTTTLETPGATTATTTTTTTETLRTTVIHSADLIDEAGGTKGPPQRTPPMHYVVLKRDLYRIVTEHAGLDAIEARQVLGTLEHFSPNRHVLTRFEVIRLFKAANYNLVTRSGTDEERKVDETAFGELRSRLNTLDWANADILACCGGPPGEEDWEERQTLVFDEPTSMPVESVSRGASPDSYSFFI